MVLHLARPRRRVRRRRPGLALANPIAPELSDMRPSLLPGLIAAAQRNADRGHGDVALFEVGQIFLGDGEADQRIAAGAIRRGTAKERNREALVVPSAGVDLFDAKADAFAFFRRSAFLPRLQLVPAVRPGFTLAARRHCNWGRRKNWRVWRDPSAPPGSHGRRRAADQFRTDPK